MTNVTRVRQRARVRAKVAGTSERPRLVATISNRQVVAQLVDDTSGKSLAQVSSVGSKSGGNLTAKSVQVGAAIAAEAKKHKIKRVVFDRAGRIYHGRLAALAEAARKDGLEF